MSAAARRLLVTGAGGQVGAAVARLGARAGWHIFAPGRSELDLSAPASIRAAFRHAPLSAVINCGAYTAVDLAESQRELAHAVNALAPGIIAEECATLGIPLVQVSTDYVFDGAKPDFYREDDPVRPASVYGRTKAAGEDAVRRAAPQHAIVRTAWVVSDRGHNFVRTMLRLAAERPEVRVVDDQRGCPTAADDLAEALLAITATLGERSGTWHFVNSGEASWHELAAFCFSLLSARGQPVPRLTAIGTADFPTAAPRPRNSRLATDKVRADFELAPRAWPEAVAEVVDRLCATARPGSAGP